MLGTQMTLKEELPNTMKEVSKDTHNHGYQYKLYIFKIFATRDEALIVERQVKGWSRKKKAALLGDDWELIKKLSNQ